MKIEPTYFIEQVRYSDGFERQLSLTPYHLFKWSQQVNKKHGIEVIAIFKIYPRQSVVIAKHDKEVNATVVTQA